MKYFKITNKEEKHNAMQYKTGLNTDVVPAEYCGKDYPGGIYFAGEDIFAYIYYGCYVREVIIPDDVECHRNDFYNVTEYKASSVVLGERRDLFTIETFQWLIDNGANINTMDGFLFKYLKDNGYTELYDFVVDYNNKFFNIHELLLLLFDSHRTEYLHVTLKGEQGLTFGIVFPCDEFCDDEYSCDIRDVEVPLLVQNSFNDSMVELIENVCDVFKGQL